MKLIFNTFVNYKLAPTKGIANDRTTKAFAICLFRDGTPCCSSCWPSTAPEGVPGGVRTLLQRIWWDRSLGNWMFLGTDFMISILASSHMFSSVQFSSLSHVLLFVNPRTAARQASLSNTSSWSLPKLMSIESVMPSNYLILCCLLLFPPSIFPSIRVFSSDTVLCLRCPN